jgi:hypothetical protein
VGQALLDLENAASSDPTSEIAVDAALAEFSEDATRRVVLLMTDDSGDVSPGLADRLVDDGVSLYYVQAAVGAEPVGTLTDTAEATGGRAQAGDLRGLIRTVDRVRTDLENQYDVRFESTGDAEAEVQVTTAAGVLSESVDLAATAPEVRPPAEGATSPSTTAAAEDADGGGSNGAVVAIAALLLLLAAAAGAAWVLRGRRRPAPPPAPAPAVIDLRQAQPAPEPQAERQEQPERGASS